MKINDSTRAKSKILVIDDDPSYRHSMMMFLFENFQDIEVLQGENGLLGIEILLNQQPDLILCDIEMPYIDGFETIRRIRELIGENFLPIIIMTSSERETYKQNAIRECVDDFIIKTMDKTIIELKIKSLLKIKQIMNELQKSNDIISVVVKAIEAKDPYTKGHSESVSKIAVNIGRVMGLNFTELQLLKLGGLVHDIGKIGVPDTILNKTDKLTNEEFEIIKKHPEIGANIIENIKNLQPVKDIIEKHHEKLNGRGYPHGLKEAEIPIMARIITVADIFDALTSDRSYRSKMTTLEAVTLMFEMSKNNEIDMDILQMLAKSILK